MTREIKVRWRNCANTYIKIDNDFEEQCGYDCSYLHTEIIDSIKIFMCILPTDNIITEKTELKEVFANSGFFRCDKCIDARNEYLELSKGE